MCGIIGYVGYRDALPVLLDGLRRLEYRGYDSAGVAVLEDGEIAVRKTAGKLSRLADMMALSPVRGQIGIGHTRWATHGVPTDENAHPHTDCSGALVVIHNGIIENFLALRERLARAGHRFRSDTDTEVIAHLIEEAYAGADGAPDRLESAVRRAIAQTTGAYAIVVMARDHPDRIVAVRQISPLIVGRGRGETILASDVPALLPYTREVVVIEDGEMAILTPEGVTITDLDGAPRERPSLHIDWDAEMAEKGGFPHFMLKEIHEQPRALSDTMMGRLDVEGRVELEGVRPPDGFVEGLQQVWITACGTAYHAGLVGRWLIEHLARIPTEVELASEFRYRDPLVAERTWGIAISQSGETADTLAAAREARRRGARLLAITNVVGSTLSREANDLLYIRAGPEIAVASSKAYLTMLAAQVMLAIDLAARRGTASPAELDALLAGLRALPAKLQAALELETEVAALARRHRDVEHVFFIGRGLDYPVAMEGSLKLKEISYVHSEALAAGELKHGTLALVTPGTPVVALVTQRHVYEKTVSNIQEVKARGAEVIAVAYEDDEEIGRHADRVIGIPRTHDLLAPLVAIVPLQLLAYHVARARGHDIDQPRNLAKSVTVE
ncbi:MAG: glutamine--fructose-6-phosphate transaminase (isomerizing) [bacterium]